MMNPRLASWRLDLDSFVACAYRTTTENWRRLPMQWRGFVLHHQRFGHTAEAVLDLIDRGQATAKYDPQGAFDAFNGISPQ
jgi:hypothetical protein